MCDAPDDILILSSPCHYAILTLCYCKGEYTIREIYFGTGMLEHILLMLTFDEFCGEMLELVISV